MYKLGFRERLLISGYTNRGIPSTPKMYYWLFISSDTQSDRSSSKSDWDGLCEMWGSISSKSSCLVVCNCLSLDKSALYFLLLRSGPTFPGQDLLLPRLSLGVQGWGVLPRAPAPTPCHLFLSVPPLLLLGVTCPRALASALRGCAGPGCEARPASCWWELLLFFLLSQCSDALLQL